MTEPSSSNTPPDWPFEHLHQRARWGMLLQALVATLALVGSSLLYVHGPLALMREDDPPGALFFSLYALAMLVVLVLALWHATARWQHTRYALTPLGLRIQRGVFWRSDTLVPRTRVQHTDLHRGPLDRLLGLAGLRVYTAGSELMRVTLNGLDFERATALRDALVQVDEGSDAL